MRDRLTNLLLALFGTACGLAMTVVTPKFPILPRVAVDALFWGGSCVAATCAIIVLILTFWPREKLVNDVDSEMGDFNTFYGNVKPPKRLGSGNTFVGPTDDLGNTIVNQPTTVGYKAKGGPGSVVIGAFASGGGKKNL